jgi:hypothetical protein
LDDRNPGLLLVSMKSITPHIILFSFIFIITFQSGWGQTVSVKASINKEKILIGEPIELQLEATVPVGMVATWFPLDTLQHFDFIDKGKIDTTITADYKTYHQTITITSFDSGRWSVASLPLEIGNRQYLTDSLPVSVAFVNFDVSSDYHDIKDILEVQNQPLNFVNWIIAGVAVLSLLGIIYFIRTKETVPPPVTKKAISKLSPIEEALQSLETLRQKGSVGEGGSKIFHTQLNDIFRWYLYRKTNLGTMEKTSGELMVQLKQWNIPQDAFVNLAQTLRMGDAVKFAKYQPEGLENNESLNNIKHSIELLDKIISS